MSELFKGNLFGDNVADDYDKLHAPEEGDYIMTQAGLVEKPRGPSAAKEGAEDEGEFPSWWDSVGQTVSGGLQSMKEGIQGGTEEMKVASDIYDNDFLAKIGLHLRESGRVAIVLQESGFTKEEINNIARRIFRINEDVSMTKTCFHYFLQVDDFEDIYHKIAPNHIILHIALA